MQKSRTINNILGWIVFLIASVTYLLTLEPTASWWDCSEFITSAFKLEVGHPPGAPFHVIMGRVFSLFAPDSSKAALMVNTLSALASAATVMLLYWSIVHLARKLFSEKEVNAGQQIAIWGSGLVGALAFTFTDSFWYSAVEGEVYALSSFFTAAVFWAILKWENVADEPFANRWLILIGYLIGLSIGVHLLNLLAVPAIGLVYYFRKYPFSWKGVVVAMIASVGLLGAIQYLIIPGIPKLAFAFDKVFVNTFGMPFNSGVLFMILLIVVASVWAVLYTLKKGMVMWNSAITFVIVILIGYSSFVLIVIRANANPPMNQNNPENAFALQRYLNREQYGDRPLFYGPYFNAPPIANTDDKDQYNEVDGKYKVTGKISGKTLYEPKMETFFPRMYSNQSNHVQAYKDWGKIKGTPVRVQDGNETKTLSKPTFGENIRFFFTYQIGHMYMRYFMWNFVGRQNDIQGHGSFSDGNWISGISWFDNAKIGPRDKMPGFMKNDPSRNTYFFLPLLFGLIGMFYQYNNGRKGKQDFSATLMLFLFTGLAIIIYLNQYPYQPRERDYAYAGSYYAFAIWIGLAVPAFYSMVQKFLKGTTGAVAVTVVSLVLVPGILAAQNWEDHDRSGRYMTRDYAIDYLESCAPNAILLTYGDNDTFPLWYVQEVEGVRPDIKIINMSYLGMDWYIDQHCKASNKAAPMPFTFTKDQYYMGNRDAILFVDRIKGSVELSEAMRFVGSDDERAKVQVMTGEKMNFFPSRNFHITVDKQKVLNTGTLKAKFESLIVDSVKFRIGKSYITKSELAVLNMIAANNWERPVYIDHSLLYSNSIFFLEYLQFEGLAYRFVPIRTNNNGIDRGRIDTEILYNNVMKKFVWGNVNDPKVYLDEYNRKAVNILQTRYMFARLAKALIEEGDKKKATEVLDKLFEIYPDSKIPLTFDSMPSVELYYLAGETEKANKLVRILTKNSFEKLEYFTSLPANFAGYAEDDQNNEISLIQNMKVLTGKYNQPELSKEIDQKLNSLIKGLEKKMGS